jgi:AcrR family transcriptional regulator
MDSSGMMLHMTADAADVPSRVDRRKERTRNALLGAARTFLSEGRTNVSIQEITDAADVGFGSFYNHFETKEALFEAAVDSTLQAYAVLRDALVAGYDDPAEVFSVSFRMTGRLQRQLPEMVRVLLHEGMRILTHDEGLAPRARRDIETAREAGRFDVPDAELALMAAGGALLGLLQLLEANPDLDAGERSDAMTTLVLRMFGMSPEEAAELVSRELPPQPDI